MSDPPPLERQPDDALRVDAPCATCGYNLRGLTGDPIRCPECGRRYVREELVKTIAAARLRAFPPLPIGTVLIAWAAIVFGPVALLVTSSPILRALTLAAFLASWGAGIRRFRRGVGARRGWWLAAAAYHLALVAFPVSLVGMVTPFILFLIAALTNGPVPRSGSLLFLAIAAGFGGVLAVSLMLYAYAWKTWSRMRFQEAREWRARLRSAPPKPADDARPPLEP